MEYQDFTIDIRSAGRGRFEAKVVDAAIEESPRISFGRPLDKRVLRRFLQEMDQRVLDVSKKRVDGKPPRRRPKLSSRKVGQQLYSTLLRGEMESLFDRCRAALPRDGKTGLRLRLRFLLNDTEAEYLGALPWEWIWDPRSTSFMATERSTPLVRDFAVPSRGPLELPRPLRILVVDAAPGTMNELNLKLEYDRMGTALRVLTNRGEVELLKLGDPSPEALRDELLAKDIHILHFMGHGGYHEGSRSGAVYFVTADGQEDQVDGEELACFLKDIPSLRLVVLNACHTARHAGHAGAPFYYGVGSAILERAGVPAVVANQHAISDDAAIAFSEIFYARLASGDDVDAALTEARLRLRRKSSEWATPVLFLAGQSGKIFTLTPAGNGRGALVLPAVEAPVEPVRLGVRSIIGYGADMEERNHEVLDLAEYFDGRFIREPKDWQGIIFPKLRDFLQKNVDAHRPLLLDFAAHSSIAFAAGWFLEAKSGLNVRVRQRTSEVGELEWRPDDGSAGKDEEALWLERPDIEIHRRAPDVALSLAVSQPRVADHVEAFLQRKGLPVGRILDATIAPEPGPRSVRGGAHALRLAQALLPRLRERYPHEREGSLHLFCAGPNALLFYLGQLSRSFESIALYEFPFGAKGGFGQYQLSIELPPPAERQSIPWKD
jgi:CHAT domain/SMODS-associated and fused to various effectors sensor domain